MEIKRIAIYGRRVPESAHKKIQLLFEQLDQAGFNLCIYEPFFDFLNPKIALPKSLSIFDKASWDASQHDMFLAIGGDGTFLDSTLYVRDSGLPILGLNTGRLGFLSGVSLKELGILPNAILNGEFELYKRATLKIEGNKELFDGNNFALNEVTLHKKDSASMITIHAYLNGEYLNSYWADGLIIATPTGSTAYSLSCGGPILFPGSNNFVITPVAPHNLNARPVVIPDHKSIKLKIEGRSQFFLASLDSRSKSIDSSTEMVITKNSFFIHLLRLTNHSYLSTIRNKLSWGLDSRNG